MEIERRILQATFGDQFVENRGYEAERGMLTSRDLTPGGGGAVAVASTYAYDTRGYLQDRTETRSGGPTITEHFGHDELGRLTDWHSDEWEVGYTYDDIGNMGTRTLSSASANETKAFTSGGTLVGPHAVTSVTTNGAPTSYGYDSAGRQTTGPDRTVTYTDFDLPLTVTKAAGTWSFKYDANNSRTVKQGPSGTTIYFGGLYEKRTVGGTVTHVMYIPGEGEPVAQVTQVAGGTPSLEYFHTDHLGTPDVITQSGGTATRMKFDPFGSRLAPDSLASAPMSTPPPLASVTKGFTGHEEDDDLGLINMGGRIYDPLIARFLTADPIVGKPEKSQHLNRYSYALNSPLMKVDPTGLWIDDLMDNDDPPGEPPRSGADFDDPGPGPQPLTWTNDDRETAKAAGLAAAASSTRTTETMGQGAQAPAKISDDQAGQVIQVVDHQEPNKADQGAYVQSLINAAHRLDAGHPSVNYLSSYTYYSLAISAAIYTYGINMSYAVSIAYAPSQTHSFTDFDRNIFIGNAAFSSASWLALTIGHEAEVHAVQTFDNNISAQNDSMAGHVNELQARLYEIKNADRFGLSGTYDQVSQTWSGERGAVLNEARGELNSIHGEYRDRVEHGSFVIDERDKH